MFVQSLGDSDVCNKLINLSNSCCFLQCSLARTLIAVLIRNADQNCHGIAAFTSTFTTQIEKIETKQVLHGLHAQPYCRDILVMSL